MANVKFNVTCTASYEGELEVPNYIEPDDTETILEYIRDNLGDVNIISKLEWLNDLDPDEAVIEDDLISIDDKPIVCYESEERDY